MRPTRTNNKHLESINRKAHSIRVRNNKIEIIVSSLHPDPNNPANSVLINRNPPLTDARRAELWEEAMSLIGEQFASIQELIGMTL